MDTITRMNLSALKAIISARKVPMIVGAPGTGKTETLRKLADDLGYELITILGSTLDPTDLTGLPKGEPIGEDENGETIYGTVYLAPWWQVRIHQHKKVVLFLDEFSNTSGSVRAGMLTMLQNREFPNGRKMPAETIVMGAMNPTEQAADGYELDMPTTNRLFFLPWKPSTEEWLNGMLNAWNRPNVSASELEWKRKVVGFINDNPSWLHREPNDVNSSEVFNVNQNDPSEMEVLRSAWASRRSWDNLSQVLAHTPPDETSIQDLIAQGSVGYAAAAEFRDWLRKNDRIDVRKVLSDLNSINWNTISLDDSNLVLRAAVSMINSENVFDVLNVFGAVADAGRADLGAPFIIDLMRKSTSREIAGNKIKEVKANALELSKKYKDVARRTV